MARRQAAIIAWNKYFSDHNLDALMTTLRKLRRNK
jgi:hypothetical protein